MESAISRIETGKLPLKRSEVVENVKKLSVYIDYGPCFGECH